MRSPCPHIRSDQINSNHHAHLMRRRSRLLHHVFPVLITGGHLKRLQSAEVQPRAVKKDRGLHGVQHGDQCHDALQARPQATRAFRRVVGAAFYAVVRLRGLGGGRGVECDGDYEGLGLRARSKGATAGCGTHAFTPARPPARPHARMRTHERMRTCRRLNAPFPPAYTTAHRSTSSAEPCTNCRIIAAASLPVMPRRSAAENSSSRSKPSTAAAHDLRHCRTPTVEAPNSCCLPNPLAAASPPGRAASPPAGAAASSPAGAAAAAATAAAAVLLSAALLLLVHMQQPPQPPQPLQLPQASQPAPWRRRSSRQRRRHSKSTWGQASCKGEERSWRPSERRSSTWYRASSAQSRADSASSLPRSSWGVSSFEVPLD